MPAMHSYDGYGRLNAKGTAYCVRRSFKALRSRKAPSG
jgi:hypothetical protein